MLCISVLRPRPSVLFGQGAGVSGTHCTGVSSTSTGLISRKQIILITDVLIHTKIMLSSTQSATAPLHCQHKILLKCLEFPSHTVLALELSRFQDCQVHEDHYDAKQL